MKVSSFSLNLLFIIILINIIIITTNINKNKYNYDWYVFGENKNDLPKVLDNQILFKDNRIFYVKNNHYMMPCENLYITRKSKKILHKTKNGFNKYAQLNNFILHAGLGDYMPESLFISYKEAIRRGYKIVDADLVFTKDKIPVIAHGINLEKMSNGKGDLTEKTLEELEQLDFGSFFSKKYKGEKILKFEDLLKLCKENNVIIDLDVTHSDYHKFFEETNEYIIIILGLIEKYGMVDSIFINESRPEVIEKFISRNKGLTFSICCMNERSSIERIKDRFNYSKMILYNMGLLQSGKSINEATVKYGLSLGRKIKASKIDDINLANKVVSWGVGFICTNKLHPFMIKNEKEEPIIANCTQSKSDVGISECKINENYILRDNEEYSIYYFKNFDNISEDIDETPIGKFKYIDTNILGKLYYNIKQFDFKNNAIKLNTSKIVKKGEKIRGRVGPTYDNVAECFVYNIICQGNGNNIINCVINKNDSDKVQYEGDYKIYSLEGYSLSHEQICNKMRHKNHFRRFLTFIYLFIVVLIIGVKIYLYKIKYKKKYRFMRASNNFSKNENVIFK